MNLPEMVAMITNLGVSTAYSLILLYWVISKISRILDDISSALKDLNNEIKSELKEVKTLLYMKGGRKHEISP